MSLYFRRSWSLIQSKGKIGSIWPFYMFFNLPYCVHLFISNLHRSFHLFPSKGIIHPPYCFVINWLLVHETIIIRYTWSVNICHLTIHTNIQVEWNVSASFQGVGCLSDNNNNWKIYWEPPAARTTDHVLCLFMCFGFCCCCCCCRFFLLWSFKVYLTQSGVCVVYTNWI